jgi:HSP20 family protein
MTYATTYDPSAHAYLAEVLPRMFKGFFEEPSTTPPSRRPVASFAVDVHEDAAAYTLVGNLPGFSKDDIKVEIDGNQVNIRAERLIAENSTSTAQAQSNSATAAAEPAAADRVKLLRSERFAGTYARGFSLPVEIDEAQSLAKYENGVLTLTLPKKPQAVAKRVAIN